MDSVYFAAAEDGSVKIGRSSDVAHRMDQLRCLNGGRVKLIGSFEGLGKYEKTLHRAFAHLAIEGEWFRSSDLLLRVARARTGKAMLDLIGVQRRDARGEDPLTTEEDRADLARAAEMMSEAKLIRRRVHSRIRQRRFRNERKAT